VLDVGTGSGAIALAVADELPEAVAIGTDTSLEALAVARANADRLGIAVELAHGTLPDDPGVQLLVANLPYVSEAQWRALPPEIKRYEPREALVAGPTGLEAIDALLGEVAVVARRPAAIALEVGVGQAATVAELVRRAGFEAVEARRDLAGIERVVTGR
jgi:release factor glutamine methyltransferase